MTVGSHWTALPGDQANRSAGFTWRCSGRNEWMVPPNQVIDSCQPTRSETAGSAERSTTIGLPSVLQSSRGRSRGGTQRGALGCRPGGVNGGLDATSRGSSKAPTSGLFVAKFALLLAHVSGYGCVGSVVKSQSQAALWAATSGVDSPWAHLGFSLTTGAILGPPLSSRGEPASVPTRVHGASRVSLRPPVSRALGRPPRRPGCPWRICRRPRR